MADFTPASNITTAAAVGTIAVAVLQIMSANGIHIPDSVMTSVPSAVIVLTAYLHDVYMSRKQ